MMNPIDLTIFGLIPAVAVLAAGGALWLQARATRRFDAQWGSPQPARVAPKPAAAVSTIPIRPARAG